MADSTDLRVRFAPSPTGYLHIGGARTVLFNWLLARKMGGAFVLRIEDTDRTRHVEDSVGKILDDLRWLGLTWDEGPEAGGDVGPYFQSERLDLYNKYLDQLLQSGDAYYALETTEELDALRAEARANKTAFKYPRPDPLPTIEEGLAAKEAGKPAVVRFKMPGTDITVRDEVLGDVTLAADQLEDFVIQKADGFPTYHFACIVDDELMKINFILRGQEHLMNTPKHVAMQRALSFATPKYAHLPLIFNMDGSKMGKRDKEKALKQGLVPPEIDVHDFRVSGYLPEAVLNFICLLGWSSGEEREQYSVPELVEKFGVERIGKVNAKFDREKLLAFNTDWAAKLPEDRLLEALKDCATVNDWPMAKANDELLRKMLKSCEGFRTLRDVNDKTAFLFIEDAEIEYDPKAVKKVLAKNEGAGFAMLELLASELEAVTDWTEESLEATLTRICEEKDTKLGNVAQPIRVAITGTTVSPPIYDSLVMLGKDRTLSRVRRCASAKSDG